MHKLLPAWPHRFLQRVPVKLLASLGLSLLLAACGGSNNDDSAAMPGPSTANTVVAYLGETAELKLYAGQSWQLTLSFMTSDGGAATRLALGLPAGGLPAGWRIGSNRSRCERVDNDNLCQIALTYAPVAAEKSSLVTFPYSYVNNKGEPGTGSVAIAYGAMAANAATATLSPAGPVRGVVGKTGNVVLGFATNDGSPATDLHVDILPASLPAGWASPSAALDCANFGAGAPCQLALSYTPAAVAPASVLAIGYRYRDSSGRQQTATAAIDYSAVAPNTVIASQNPAGVIRARTGTSQQVTLRFAPSDGSAASGLRLSTDAGRLPEGWTVKASTLPCATVDSGGGCYATLAYAPRADQPAGKLDLDYAYTDATGRELSGRTTVAYASHDYRAYVTDYGDIVDGEPVGGGVRQCELDSDGKLSACKIVDTAWPIFGVDDIAIYNGHAYIGAITGEFPQLNQRLNPRQLTVCNVADDNALVDCAGSGPLFDGLIGLQVSRLGVFVISTPQGFLQISHCTLAGDGGLDTPTCGEVRPTLFNVGVPYAMTSTDTRLYISATDNTTTQDLYSCQLSAGGDRIDCQYFSLGVSTQLIERMSTGQAGGKSYLYLATSPPAASMGGNIVKCVINQDESAESCGPGRVPAGLSGSDLLSIGDIRIVRDSAYLVTGDIPTNRKVYRCPINQVTGDLETCVSAGTVDGVRNYSISVR